MELPTPRFLNLVYYLLTRNLDDDKRQEFDARLNEPPVTAAQTRSGRKPPPWWKGRRGAARSSIRAAQQMGLAPAEVGS